jgi:antitoxin VapB
MRTKIFQSGGSQALRIPKEFRFNEKEVEIYREGEALIIKPIKNIDIKTWWSELCCLSDDFDIEKDDNTQIRPELNNLFDDKCIY